MFPSPNDPYEKDLRAERREGELYRVIEAHGVRFEIYYGYYAEEDRQNPFVDPMEMYPDFLTHPVHTADGIPFVTALQKTCRYFSGMADEDNTCYQCDHYEKCEELLGICRCKGNRKNE